MGVVSFNNVVMTTLHCHDGQHIDTDGFAIDLNVVMFIHPFINTFGYILYFSCCCCVKTKNNSELY